MIPLTEGRRGSPHDAAQACFSTGEEDDRKALGVAPWAKTLTEQRSRRAALYESQWERGQ